MDKSNQDKVAVIIINHNSYPEIIDCLQSLSVSFNKHFFTTFIYDNASIDNSLENIKQKFAEIRIYKNKKNMGFAKAVNKAIKNSLKQNYKYIFLLNPDTKVNKSFLDPLVQLFKTKPNVAIVAPVLKDVINNKPVYTLGKNLNKYLGRPKHKHVLSKPVKPVEESMVSGCAMLIKSMVFKKVGFFDEQFFLYFEDSDFCIRVKKAGFRIFVEPKSVIKHRTGQNAKVLSLFQIYNLLKSNFLFSLKHINKIYIPLSFLYILLIGTKLLLNKILKPIQ
jgi:GT2 family glycosyltransferase